ncbi:hypothetical protein KTH73_12895 [Acinetobacter courvalinii]|uniref:putative pilus system protein FilF n=1 Tax=Acinetobacter courvalinii TaxID=280147 RepID=UPI0021CD39A3|nr:hypothetical protein [Acinetobacter courvalinii]MCU4391616.1 hypothetical protein [Acinetobacter courvalinii]
MNKKILLPFAVSTLALMLHGCGGESAKINEDPTKGVEGVTSNTSCAITADNCLRFVMDYPVTGLNFDCSTDKFNHFATKLEGNIVTGACKLGDSINFYIQGEGARKINLGTLNLDTISKTKMAIPPRIRLIDLAIAMTGQKPTTLNMSDDTTRVAVALIKILQSLGAENGDNVIGDIQPIELSKDKKNQLIDISKDIGTQEFISGEYVEILKPWLNVEQVSDAQALALLTDLLNLSNTGVWQADAPFAKQTGDNPIASATGDGFFGCNRDDYNACTQATDNLLHSMGGFLLISDRQGYILGYGQQWRGPAAIVDKIVFPYVLTTKVKPQKIQVNAQNLWFNQIDKFIKPEQPLRFSLNNEKSEDLLLTQGQLINGTAIAGTERIYKQLNKLKDSDSVDPKLLGAWQQTIAGETYKGRIDIIRVNPSSYLSKDIFKTEANVQSKQQYIFPLYATLNFKFQNNEFPAVDIGIVIDEKGDIRTDIKANATDTDKSGICGTVKSVNSDGTITDSNDQIQYRIGTISATEFSAVDKSLVVRMILSNPKFGNVDGAIFGLNLTAGTGAKINIHNLLAGQANGINLTNFLNETANWSNTYAAYQLIYNTTYDNLKDAEKNKYIKPTDEERALAKRYSGTVSIKIADQSIPACNAIKIKS